MKHAIHSVTRLQHRGPFILEITFEDGTSQTIDFRSVLRGEIYGPLNDPAVFDAVRLDEEAHTLVWPNGADFDPAILHDWPEKHEGFEQLASNWASVGAK